MSIWARIGDALGALRDGEGLTAVLDRLRTPPERSAAFTIAVIGLGAKMAKADGQVTRDEVAAFREVFHIPPEDEGHAARVFDLARTDVAGFDAYATRIGAMFDTESETLCDLMEGLFHIAMADGEYHPGEDAFLTRVAEIWGFERRRFGRIRARFVPDAERDPYEVLGVDPDASDAEVRQAWRALVRSGHPDVMIARGVPQEAVKMASGRLTAVNAAWEAVGRDRGWTHR
ncbi:MAG: TerB family tellurite resistance protein [Paracoccaceae bacterium]